MKCKFSYTVFVRQKPFLSIIKYSCFLRPTKGEWKVSCVVQGECFYNQWLALSVVYFDNLKGGCCDLFYFLSLTTFFFDLAQIFAVLYVYCSFYENVFLPVNYAEFAEQTTQCCKLWLRLPDCKRGSNGPCWKLWGTY